MSHREHFTREGEPKKKLSKERAEILADELESTNAYRCTWPGCGGWHIGRTSEDL